MIQPHVRLYTVHEIVSLGVTEFVNGRHGLTVLV